MAASHASSLTAPHGRRLVASVERAAQRETTRCQRQWRQVLAWSSFPPAPRLAMDVVARRRALLDEMRAVAALVPEEILTDQPAS